MKESYFNVGILGYMGYPILGVIICVFIFGVGTPCVNVNIKMYKSDKIKMYNYSKLI